MMVGGGCPQQTWAGAQHSDLSPAAQQPHLLQPRLGGAHRCLHLACHAPQHLHCLRCVSGLLQLELQEARAAGAGVREARAAREGERDGDHRRSTSFCLWYTRCLLQLELSIAGGAGGLVRRASELLRSSADMSARPLGGPPQHTHSAGPYTLHWHMHACGCNPAANRAPRPVLAPAPAGSFPSASRTRSAGRPPAPRQHPAGEGRCKRPVTATYGGRTRPPPAAVLPVQSAAAHEGENSTHHMFPLNDPHLLPLQLVPLQQARQQPAGLAQQIHRLLRLSGRLVPRLHLARL